MPGEGTGTERPQDQQGPSRWQFVRSFLIQVMIFYFITSFFRGQKQPTSQEGTPVPPSVNVFSFGQTLDMLVYLSEDEVLTNLANKEVLIWELNHITYGSWDEGPSRDSTWALSKQVYTSDTIQKNGSLWLHVFMRKTGYPIDTEDEDYEQDAVVYRKKMLMKYRKQRTHNTVNLLTGETAVNTSEVVTDSDVPLEIISYWHPNMTINLVADQTTWYKGSIPPPLDQFVEFDDSDSNYYPILYFNDYWNLAQDYMPVNDTTKTLELTLTFYPLSLLKFQMYASMTTKNQWTEMLTSSEDSDEEQDTVKQTLMETNPYLLGLTIIVSIVHSVFEFLAFKNDIQFWRTRKSLEGLSVRSVFFNVFQSLIVLLYVLDNDTNMVVIISCFVALLIEMWKITKVTNVSIDRDNLMFGFLPRIKFTDIPSYVQSSTKEYDKMAFKYLGWILFPLFMCYGVYSLVYQEHKGWYSFVLGLLYGFLLTFGFIIMTPQLFINYKLKSVAHLPWRMLTYKALNTFIDDMFAFVIKMPMMYRIGCFRDDIVFFIYLYQRWIYRVDPKRVNEFGTTGEDPNVGDTHTEDSPELQLPPANSPDSTESQVPSANTDEGSVRKRTSQNNASTKN